MYIVHHSLCFTQPGHAISYLTSRVLLCKTRCGTGSYLFHAYHTHMLCTDITRGIVNFVTSLFSYTCHPPIAGTPSPFLHVYVHQCLQWLVMCVGPLSHLYVNVICCSFVIPFDSVIQFSLSFTLFVGVWPYSTNFAHLMSLLVMYSL